MESSSPFDLLKTDELVVKIIKMAMESHERRIQDSAEKHKFLVDTVAYISTRFKRLAADKSLWKEPIVIRGSHKSGIRSIQSFCDFPLSKLVIHNFSKRLDGKDIQTLAAKFPSLEELILPYIQRWPSLDNPPWSSLTSLTLMVETFDCLANVKLHKTLPNLKYFRMCSNWYTTVLPDMTGCGELQAWLPDGYSRIFRIVCVWPFGLLDYGSATLRCKI